MSAQDEALRRAREYLRRFLPEELARMTLEQFCAIGRLDAKRRYKREDTQKQYALAWYKQGMHFCALFKPSENDSEVAEAQLEEILLSLKKAHERLGRLDSWTPPSGYISNRIEMAKTTLEMCIGDLESVLSFLGCDEEDA